MSGRDQHEQRTPMAGPARARRVLIFGVLMVISLGAVLCGILVRIGIAVYMLRPNSVGSIVALILVCVGLLGAVISANVLHRTLKCLPLL